jgi:hypothetical protein
MFMGLTGAFWRVGKKGVSSSLAERFAAQSANILAIKTQ